MISHQELPQNRQSSHEQGHSLTVSKGAEIQYLFRELSPKQHKMIKNRTEDKATYKVLYGSFRKISQQAEPDLTQLRNYLHAQDINADPQMKRSTQK